MKDAVEKYLIKSNRLFFNLFFVVMCIHAFVKALLWNKTFHSYWGFFFLLMALATIRVAYQMFFVKQK